jgi:hypothetical protein
MVHAKIAMRPVHFAPIFAVAFALSCGGSQPPAQPGASASSAALRSTSAIACHVDGDCAVCHRASSCGEPIAANDPGGAGEACHVAPSAFCMPRRAHCDEGHCVAR